MSANGFCGLIGAKATGAWTTAGGVAVASRISPAFPSESPGGGPPRFRTSTYRTAPSSASTMREATTAIAMMTGFEIPVLVPLVLVAGLDVPVAAGGESEKTAEMEGEGVLSPDAPVGLIPVDCVVPVGGPPPAVG